MLILGCGGCILSPEFDLVEAASYSFTVLDTGGGADLLIRV